jgi:hypothetical protein
MTIKRAEHGILGTEIGPSKGAPDSIGGGKRR